MLRHGVEVDEVDLHLIAALLHVHVDDDVLPLEARRDALAHERANGVHEATALVPQEGKELRWVSLARAHEPARAHEAAEQHRRAQLVPPAERQEHISAVRPVRALRALRAAVVVDTAVVCIAHVVRDRVGCLEQQEHLLRVCALG